MVKKTMLPLLDPIPINSQLVPLHIYYTENKKLTSIIILIRKIEIIIELVYCIIWAIAYEKHRVCMIQLRILKQNVSCPFGRLYKLVNFYVNWP